MKTTLEGQQVWMCPDGENRCALQTRLRLQIHHITWHTPAYAAARLGAELELDRHRAGELMQEPRSPALLMGGERVSAAQHDAVAIEAKRENRAALLLASSEEKQSYDIISS
jgi:hypothetical protein